MPTTSPNVPAPTDDPGALLVRLVQSSWERLGRTWHGLRRELGSAAAATAIELERETRGLEFALSHPRIAAAIANPLSDRTLDADALRLSELSSVPVVTPDDIPGAEDVQIAAELSPSQARVLMREPEVAAFRQVIWQGSIVARFGREIAEQVGALPNGLDAGTAQRIVTVAADGFKRLGDQGQRYPGGPENGGVVRTVVDLLNNDLARNLFSPGEGLSPREVAARAVAYFHAHGFYVQAPQPDGGARVTLHRISNDQLARYRRLLAGVDENGYRPDAQTSPNPERQERDLGEGPRRRPSLARARLAQLRAEEATAASGDVARRV